MKRLLSLILCAIMLSAVILPVEAIDLPTVPPVYKGFSGGSGTAEDPYLISSANDLSRIYSYYYSYPDLRLPQVHFKLTSDIKLTQWGPSRVFVEKYIGIHSFQEIMGVYENGEYCPTDVYYLGKKDAEAQAFLDRLSEAYGKNYVFEKIGIFIYGDWIPSFDHRQTKIHEVVSAEQVYKYYQTNWSESYLEIVDKYSGLYYKSGFTGVFDGNGYSITLTKNSSNNGYLFGVIKSGAVVKNLNLIGTGEVALAYEAEEGSLIENCSIYTERGFTVNEYFVYLRDQYGYYEKQDIKEGYTAIVKSNGKVKNCYNVSPLAGDIDCDCTVNLKDVNFMKRYFAGFTQETPSLETDMNIDGVVDGKDFYFLVLKVSGLYPIQ